MGPIGHTVVSVGIGAGIWASTGEPLALPLALATGVFSDSDHAIDVIDAQAYDRRHIMLRLFHAWEYTAIALVALVIWYNPLLLAVFLGHLSHLVLDQIANSVPGPHPLGFGSAPSPC